MKKIIDYTIIWATNSPVLVREVREAMKDGYVPFGELHSSKEKICSTWWFKRTVLHQAMVKYIDE